MRKKVAPVLFFPVIFIIAALTGCSSREKPELPGQEDEPAQVIVSKADWEETWEKWVQEARKEGNLTIYSTASPDVRQEVSKSLKEKYGINAGFVSGRGSGLIQTQY